MTDLQRYSGRRVLVTGGGSGIGQATTLRILREGGRVVAADISAAMSAYAASKGGIQAMTHALALEFGRQGIRFTAVQPGSISSGMTDGSGVSGQSLGPGLPADADIALFAKAAPALPLPAGAPFAGPDAVAAVVAMLGSPDAYFVTGTEVRVDGGSHM